MVKRPHLRAALGSARASYVDEILADYDLAVHALRSNSSDPRFTAEFTTICRELEDEVERLLGCC
ncbi:hypothetical protein IB238_23515 [Rhizobium sp. ARZ01]|uniref:hypothetical protein n=1 Tax=Rhizobium sp. ARZ01 TaxID=2769313 RepID=UPI00177D4792|nr:hypothetical protein [Rhizobium sp. ARZ01]MBD9375581.1 hypothetical protein [Rhizobium sp. ARZ01]